MTAAAALNASPLWNLMPGRSSTVHVFKSAETDALFARRPTKSFPRVFSNNVSYTVRVAMSAEFAGLLPTQKPGKVSKIPTFTSPPYFGADGFEAA